MAEELSQSDLDALLAGTQAGGSSEALATTSTKGSAAPPTGASASQSAVTEQAPSIEELTKAQASSRPEIGAATLARMAGLATSSELKIIDGKMDLLAGRVANLTIRVERALTMLGNLPSGNDLERVDVGVANIRTMIQELVNAAGLGQTDSPDDKVTKAKLDSFLKRKAGKGTEEKKTETPAVETKQGN